MNMINVDSTAMNAIGYDPKTRVLRIEFVQGQPYNFCNVPQNIFDGLKNAIGFHGEYFNDHIRDKYPC